MGTCIPFKIRGWLFADPARAIELALAGGGVDIPLAAFGFEIGGPFLYQYNLFIPMEIDCRIANLTSIPNYADRHGHGEPIATGFVESAVNQVVRKRLVRRRRMRWTPSGAHRLLQVRTACSISGCAVILSAGTRTSSLCRSRFVWRRSTRNGTLSSYKPADDRPMSPKMLPHERQIVS
jgi:hypothetical protein